MRIPVKCSNVDALLGQVIDGIVPEADKKAFHTHIASCDRCKRSYELEVVAKSLVQQNLPRVSTPMHVRRAVLSSLYGEAERASRPFLSRIFGLVPTPAYAVVAAAALIVYLFFPSQQTSLDDMIRHAGERDVMEQAASNFALIRDGKMKPPITTCSPENMYAYLEAQELPFEAVVRPLERCDGYSAVVNEYDGVKLAHVVYSIGDDMLYVYQVRGIESLNDGGHLTMPAAAKEALTTTGWYTDPQHPDCNVVLWEENGTVCAATSTMSKTGMLALLATR